MSGSVGAAVGSIVGILVAYLRIPSFLVTLGMLSVVALADEVAAETLPEKAWRPLDPSRAAFANMNTLADWAAHRERG